MYLIGTTLQNKTAKQIHINEGGDVHSCLFG
jgi:hypothetical protein